MRPKVAKADAVEPSHINDWKAYRSIQQRVQSTGVSSLWPDDLDDKRHTSGCAKTFCSEIEGRTRQVHGRSIGSQQENGSERVRDSRSCIGEATVPVTGNQGAA